MRRLASEPKARLLIVDDEPIVGSRLKDLLGRDGYSVDSLTDGQAAIDAIGAGDYDLVITDLKMGGVDGFMVLDAARSKFQGPGVIVISGYADLATAEEAREGGAIGFVPKPFKLEEIKRVIERYLNDTVFSVS